MRFPSRFCLALALAAGAGQAGVASEPGLLYLAAFTPEHAATPEPGTSPRPHVEESQLNRLVRELEKSARSSAYLRTVGFDLTDRQFEELIAANGAILRETRIVRRDEKGNRIIPGWPGVALNRNLGEKRGR